MPGEKPPNWELQLLGRGYIIPAEVKESRFDSFRILCEEVMIVRGQALSDGRVDIALGMDNEYHETSLSDWYT